ncbi:MAG TPA: DUF3231 family protein [Candidatus Thermoplasmatota archaeon]|nr:DUF3231 family protein [Candidatus Thermoplasmatota archaeon]
MAIVDKIQGTIEKLTNDDTRLNSAEITTIQQTYNALQLGLLKTHFYIDNVQSGEVKEVLVELRDEFIKPNLEKPRRILDKAGIPYLDLHVQERVNNAPGRVGSFLRDEEVLLDTVLSLQATITGLQAGALAAVRGDVRDYFLNARDAAVDQWRRVGFLAYKIMPQAIPPTMSGVTQP